MDTRHQLATIWPIYDLLITTPRLTLRLPTERETADLARLAGKGIQDPASEPLHFAWFCEPPPLVERKLLQFVFRTIANWESESWELGLAIFQGAQPIGMQSIFSEHFDTTRGFGSSVWLGREYQGRGFGTEAGRAVLKLGFDALGGSEAYVGAWADNAASIRVMEKLGYLPNGRYRRSSGGRVRFDVRMRLPREAWQSPPDDEITIEGVERCLELFGIAGRAGQTGMDKAADHGV